MKIVTSPRNQDIEYIKARNALLHAEDDLRKTGYMRTMLGRVHHLRNEKSNNQ